MIYTNFDAIFPKIAELETRSVTVSEDSHVPIGEYAFLPSFCMDKKCDCRRALINVKQVNPAYGNFHAATISYGWENMGFYREWSQHLSDELLEEFRGPSLDIAQKQSPYADFFLEFFKSELLTDKEYVSRIKRHYAYMKMKQMSKLPKELNKLIDHFGACPCDSGKPFRVCCGKKKSRLSRRR